MVSGGVISFLYILRPVGDCEQVSLKLAHKIAWEKTAMVMVQVQVPAQ
jgi:hypothetical protein